MAARGDGNVLDMWRLVDGMADWLRNSLGVQAQLRMGVLMVLGSVPLVVYGAWTSEPFLVYEMSAAALLFGGIGVVVTAETLSEVAEDVDGDDRCPSCGQPTRQKRPTGR